MIGGEKILASREGAAEGGWGGEFRLARASRRSEAEAVSSLQKRFEQRLVFLHKNVRINIWKKTNLFL